MLLFFEETAAATYFHVSHCYLICCRASFSTFKLLLKISSTEHEDVLILRRRLLTFYRFYIRQKMRMVD